MSQAWSNLIGTLPRSRHPTLLSRGLTYRDLHRSRILKRSPEFPSPYCKDVPQVLRPSPDLWKESGSGIQLVLRSPRPLFV